MSPGYHFFAITGYLLVCRRSRIFVLFGGI